MGINGYWRARLLAGSGSAVAELLLVSCACAALSLWPSLGPWPLLPGLVPPLLRLARRIPVYRRAGYLLPLAAFTLTALVGVWAAYDRVTAWEKYWLLAGSGLLFLALGQLDGESIGRVLPLGLALCSAFAAIFLLSTDWNAVPADLAILNRIGQIFSGWRPAHMIPVPGPNIAGGYLAMAAPFCVPAFLITRRSPPHRAAWLRAGWAVATGLILVALLMSSSRAAWLALAAAAGIWLAGHLTGRSLCFPAALGGGLLMAAALLLFIVISPAIRVTPFAGAQSGVVSAASRADLLLNSIDLAGAFRYTGGGLGAFPGLYSQYILGIPHFYFAYSHNLYIDLALEQGGLGLAAFLAVWVGSTIHLVRSPAQERGPFTEITALRQAALAAMTVALFHGLLDDSLYAAGGSVLVFLAPGIALAASESASIQPWMPLLPWSGRARQAWAATLALLTATAAILVAVFGGKALASLGANLGAVDMARVQLHGWPTGVWSAGEELPKLDNARARFEHALELSPQQPTARYHLGLIAMLDRDYQAAVDHLLISYESNPQHRGVRKALGLSYAWRGSYTSALPLFADIPESAQELQEYEWWWATQERPDLSERARRMGELLARENANPG